MGRSSTLSTYMYYSLGLCQTLCLSLQHSLVEASIQEFIQCVLFVIISLHSAGKKADPFDYIEEPVLDTGGKQRRSRQKRRYRSKKR